MPRGARLVLLVSIVLLLVTLVPAFPAGAAAPPMGSDLLRGRAMDPRGHALSDVEVYIAGSAVGGSHLFRARTDQTGRFAVAGLVPGLYRITAVKGGYRVAVTRVNTVVRQSLDLILHPAGEPSAPGERPEDMGWVLRLPGRDLLGDQEQIDGRPTMPATIPHSFLEAVAGSVEHWYSTDLSHGAAAAAEGQTTRIEVSAPLGPSFRLGVKGAREDMELDTGGSSSRLRRHRFHTNAGVTTSESSSLAMTAWMDRGDREFALAEASLPLEEPSSTEAGWGYDARWAKALGSAASMDLGLGYRELSLDLVGVGARELYASDLAAVGSREVVASGALTAELGSDHLVRVALGALRYDHSTPDGRLTLDSLGGDALDAGVGVGGWRYQLEASDDWRIAGPVVVSYGLGYRSSRFGEDLAYLIPRAGLLLEAGPTTRIAGFLSWLVEDGSYPGTLPERHGVNRLGYQLSLDQRLGPRGNVVFSTESRPVQQAFLGVDGREIPMAAEARLFFLADESATSSWTGAEWNQRFRGGSGLFGLGKGSVEGRIAPRLPGDLPLLHLRLDRLELQVAKAGVRIDSIGTAVEVQYRQLESQALAGSGEDPERYQRVAVYLDQEIPFLRFGDVRWRVMLVYQGTLREPVETEPVDELAALRRSLVDADRFSGGLAVSF